MWHSGFLKSVAGAYAAVGAVMYAHDVLHHCHGVRSPTGAVLALLLAPAIYLVSTGWIAARRDGAWILATSANSALAAGLGGTGAALLFAVLQRIGPACGVPPPCKGCVATPLLDSTLPLVAIVAAAFLLAPAVGWIARAVDAPDQ